MYILTHSAAFITSAVYHAMTINNFSPWPANQKWRRKKNEWKNQLSIMENVLLCKWNDNFCSLHFGTVWHFTNWSCIVKISSDFNLFASRPRVRYRIYYLSNNGEISNVSECQMHSCWDCNFNHWNLFCYEMQLFVEFSFMELNLLLSFMKLNLLFSGQCEVSYKSYEYYWSFDVFRRINWNEWANWSEFIFPST